MNRVWCPLLLAVLPWFCQAQVDHIMIPAGTPADQDLQAISTETDSQKKIAAYEEFVQKYSSDPSAVAFGNWQLAQAYQTAGDLPKALAYGDKALVGSSHNFDILVSQANIAAQMKDNAKVMEYAEKGGEAYRGIAKQPRPADVTEQDFANRVSTETDAVRSSYEYLQTVGFNAIVDEKNPKARMSYIERYAAAFPDSKYADQVSQYAMYTLGPGQLNDQARLVAFGEKSLARNPDNVPALLLLANAYVEDTKPTSWAKAVTYAQKVVMLSKGDAPGAERSRKLSAGVAHSTLGFAYMKQDKTAASVPELKSASELLKGQDDVAYTAALYRLGYAYAKLNKPAEAREVLIEVIQIPGPLQQPSKDLLAKISAAKASAK
jgi:tetratricopeptide (TPR) repeat protein